jgi:TM2 domain-containing membrane protein YozV
MSDDKTRTDGWGSSDAPGNPAQNETQSATPTEGARVGFCQDCGKPLTQATVRAVGTGVFCESCLTARVGATIPPVGYAGVPPIGYAPVPPATSGDPSPVLAAILGFIPGVGAMYNGQFAKGVVHLAIFAILTSLSSNVNGIFGLFVAGWEFYMAFEAYHTAVARRDGLPLPNPFGFNDIGERMGFGKSWGNIRPAGAPVPPPAGVPPYSEAVPVAEPYSNAAYAPVNPVPVGTAPDWVGYVPPTAFTGTAASEAAAAQIREQTMRDAGYYNQQSYNQQAYASNYAGPATPLNPDAIPSPYSVNVPSADILVGKRRFPAGAFWLIGLGVLILAANLLPDWKLTARWWPPLLFAGLAAWTFTRRLHSGARLVCIIRWPVILMVLAIMFALHAAYVPVTFGLTASVLLIVFGTLLLLERAAGADPNYVPLEGTADYTGAATNYPGTTSVVPPPDLETPTRAAWDTPVVDSTSSDPDGTKGGQ